MEPQVIESNLNDESKSEIESQFNELISNKNRSLLTPIFPQESNRFESNRSSNRTRRNRRPILTESIPSEKKRIEIAKNESGPPCPIYKGKHNIYPPPSRDMSCRATPSARRCRRRPHMSWLQRDPSGLVCRTKHPARGQRPLSPLTKNCWWVTYLGQVLGIDLLLIAYVSSASQI